MAVFANARGSHNKDEYSPFDIGTVYKEIARYDNKKYELIQSIWKPDIRFKFPKSVEGNLKKRWQNTAKST